MTLVTGAHCVVECCNSTSRDRVLLHNFPEGGQEREAWINFVRGTNGDDWVPDRFSMVCARHFAVNCYESKLSHPTEFTHLEKLLRVSWHLPVLKPGAVPTVCCTPAVEDASVSSLLCCPGGASHQPTLQGTDPALQGSQPVLQGHHPVLQGHRTVHQGSRPVLQRHHPVLQGHHFVLQGHNPVLQVPHSVVQGPYPVLPLPEVPGPPPSEGQPRSALPDSADAKVPGGATDGKSKPKKPRKVNLDPAVVEERRKARAAREAARRAAIDPAVREAKRQAAAARRAAKKAERQAAKLAEQEAYLEKMHREWVEQQQQVPRDTEAETMVLGIPGPSQLQQFGQPSVKPAGPSLHPAFRIPLTRDIEMMQALAGKTDAQTQYTVQMVVKTAQAAVLPKVKSIALQTDNRALGPRTGKSCKLLAPSRTVVSSTNATAHRAIRRRGLRNFT